MKSFHNKPELKEMMLEEVLKHQKADEIIQGSYESRGKYCAVGCSIESLNMRLGKHYSHGDHSVYETELGIPKIIARLEDRIFEGLERKKAKMFPLRFIQAVPVGVDLSLVWPKFAIWLLGDGKDGVIKYVETDEQKKIIIDIVELYKRVIAGESIESLKKEFAIAAADAAAANADASAATAAAAYATAYATASAAITATAYATTATTAATAAYDDAYAAATAANAAYDDAYAAATAAYDDAYAAATAAATAAYDDAYDDAYAAATAAYDDAYAAATAARKNHYSKCADKLLEILATS
jgi:hypothetical protein